GKLGEDPSLDPVVGIGAAIKILREQLLAARMRDDVFVEALEIGGRDFAVALPPDRVLGQLIGNRVLVLGRAAGMSGGVSTERPPFHDGGFARCNRMLIKKRRREIPMDGSEPLEAEFVGTVAAVPKTSFLHG